MPVEIIPPEELKEYRKRADLTQQEIADEVGICQSHYSYVENGNRDILFSHLRKISEFILGEV